MSHISYMFSTCLQVIFEFASGIEETLANKLKALGVTIVGDILPDSNYVEELNDSYESSDEDSETAK